jgi:hypothetical protein
VAGTSPLSITRLVGVYDADGTILGELRYWMRARFGGAHCALCDITHGSVRERPEWRACRASLPVPFDTYHRDDQPDSVRAVGPAPLVVAETSSSVVPLLGPGDLEACEGSPDALIDAIKDKALRHGLTWSGH